MDFTRTNKISSRITDVDVVIDLMIHDIDLACISMVQWITFMLTVVVRER